MKIYRFILLLIFISTTIYSQPGWEQLNSGTSTQLRNLCFISDNVGWVVGFDGLIIKTTDGGITWNQQTSNTNLELLSVYFIDELHGWIGGRDGVLLTTTNGGEVWNSSTIALSNETVGDVEFIDENTGYAIVYYIVPGNYYGYILKTSDGGLSWQTKYTIPNSAFLSVFAYQNYCWAVGIQVAAYSTDYGDIWHVDSPTDYWLYDVFFIDAHTGWTVGGLDNGNVELIMKTVDGGITWQTVREDYNFEALRGVYFINEMTGWAVGKAGRILYSSDGGEVWTLQNSPVSSVLGKVQFPSDSTGYIVGEGGVILKYSEYPDPITVLDPNGGETIAAGSNYYIEWSSTDIANVKLEYSTDDGTNWMTIVDSIPSAGIYNWMVPNTLTSLGRVRISDITDSTVFDISDDPFIIQSSHMITVTNPNGGEELQGGSTYEINWTSNEVENVKIEYSINNGATWDLIVDSVESLGAYLWDVPNVLTTQGRIKISDLMFPSVYDVSNDPFRIVYISNVDDETNVIQYNLLQNYPNPFNPSTTIKYSIKNPGFVSLKVYNILGVEVASLVNQNQQTGNYKVIFDASRLASGIYYYRLKTNGFVQTRKMILLK